MVQIGSATGIPILHTVELLDWATGGPEPAALSRLTGLQAAKGKDQMEPAPV